MAIVDFITAIGVAAALIFTAVETRHRGKEARQRDQTQRQELAMQIHRDMTLDGETASAFRRLSVTLRSIGIREFGKTTWVLLTDQDLSPSGVLDNSNPENSQPYADFYRVLWLYQRSNMAIRRGLVDHDVFHELCGFHVWWWNQLLREIHAPTALQHLRELAVAAEAWAADAGVLDGWRSRCQSDFGGLGPS